jgi:hypothetical protein
MEEIPRTGQWVGSATNEHGEKSIVIFNVEPRTPDRAQLLLLKSLDGPRMVAQATLNWSANRLRDGRIENYHVYDLETDAFIRIEETPDYKNRSPDGTPIPLSSTYEGEVDSNRLWGAYEYSTGTKGTFELKRDIEAGKKEEVPPPYTWDQFKMEMARFRGRSAVYFRGHSCTSHRLETLFHRSGRFDMIDYVWRDLPRLRHTINAHSRYRYGKDRDDTLALLSLAQHHGYPTPLLDWSRSPYVAAFFAFACDKCEQWPVTRHKAVRIFAFDTEKWPRSTVQSLRDPMASIQFGEPDAHNNPRFVPQQSVAMLSTLHNIEALIHEEQKRLNQRFLHRFDIRADQRELAIEDLRLMGITPSSLYPGFEGVCRSLRMQYFR